MKRILLTAFVFGLLLCLISGLHAQRVYPFIELTDEDLARIDLHDGSVNDWIDVLGDPALTALDFFPGSFSESYDPADLDFRIWLAWHGATNRLYVAMERADDIYANDFDRDDIWRKIMSTFDSGIDFFIDGDKGRDSRALQGSEDHGKASWFLEIERKSQWYAAIAEVHDEGPHIQFPNLPPAHPSQSRFVDLNPHGEWYLQPPYAEGGGGRFGERPTLSVTEFYVTAYDQFVWNDPQASQVSELHVGKVIDFNIVVQDWEGEAVEPFDYNQEGFFLLSSDGRWVDGLLVGADGAIPQQEDTAVESVTWGRIKATFDKEIP